MTRFLSLCICLLISLLATGQNSSSNYPSYDSIVKEFFNTYEVEELLESKEIVFAKKPTGWHVLVQEYEVTIETTQDDLFWSIENKGFQNINYELRKEDTENELRNSYLIPSEKRHYLIHPYYGYPGWELDVIKELKGIEKPSDSLLYSLGRANSSYANGLLNNNFGFSSKKHRLDLSKGRGKMTKEQLKKYRQYHREATKLFDRLALQNPNFNTWVGNIKIKAANEYVNGFLDLRIYQNEEEAKKELKEGLYSKAYISYAKNYLNSCLPNAILFTSGDNDTFPLLYVQSIYGFRKDITIINISLLNAHEYINHLRTPILDAPRIPFSITAKELAENTRDVIYVQSDEEEMQPMEIRALINTIKNDKNLELYESTSYFKIPTNKYIYSQGDARIEWSSNSNYIVLNQLMLLDLLVNNKEERPIYFSLGMSNTEYFGLDNFMQIEGLTARLTMTQGSSLYEDDFGYVDTKIMYKNMMSKFDWSGFNEVRTDLFRPSIDHRYAMGRLAEQLLLENKIAMAKEVLDTCIAKIPEEVAPYRATMHLIADMYEVLEANSTAESIRNKIQD